MARQLKQYEDDDGRVIVDMDLDGMKWHDRRIKKETREERKSKTPTGTQLTKREARRFTRYAVLAGLTLFAVYAVVWAAILLFMTQVWFK